MRHDGKGHGFLRGGGQAKFVGQSQAQAKRCKLSSQHVHECGVLRSSSGENHFRKSLCPCGSGLSYGILPHCISNCLGCERCRGCDHVLFCAASAASQKFAHEFSPEFFAARSLRRLSTEKVALQYLLDDLNQHFPRGRNLSATIERLDEEPFSDGINDHIARPGIKRDHMVGSCTGGNRGEVRDAADVLYDSSYARVAKQKVVEEGNQRRTLASSRHIRRTEIGNHRHAHSRRDNCRLSRLPSGRNPASKKALRLTLMIKRLPVATDELRLYTKPSLGSQHSIGIKFADQEIQPGQFRHACSRSVHCSQHSRASLLGVGVFRVPEQFEASVGAVRGGTGRSSAQYRRNIGSCWTTLHAHQRHIDAVSGGPAHYPGHNHVFLRHARGRREFCACSSPAGTKPSSRTCSPNSHSLRERSSSIAADGAFVLRSSFADFFLKVRTRRTDSATRLANFESDSAVLTSS